MDVLFVLGLFAVVGVLFWSTRRDREVFRIAVTRGQARVVSGRVPPSFLDDVRRVVRGIDSAVIRGVNEGGGVRIVASGKIDDARLQRLRNAFSVHAASKL